MIKGGYILGGILKIFTVTWRDQKFELFSLIKSTVQTVLAEGVMIMFLVFTSFYYKNLDIIVWVLYLLFVIREVFQLFISPKRYAFSLENTLEVFFIGIGKLTCFYSLDSYTYISFL